MNENYRLAAVTLVRDPHDPTEVQLALTIGHHETVYLRGLYGSVLDQLERVLPVVNEL